MTWSTAVQDLWPTEGDHVVHFYRHHDELAGCMGGYLAGALRAGDAVVVIASGDQRERFARTLASRDVDLAAARASGRLFELDAAETLASFAGETSLDRYAFETIVGGAIRAASNGSRRVHAYAEMVAQLWGAGGQVEAAVGLEELWNDLAARVPFSLVCAYPDSTVRGNEAGFAQVCHAHTAMVGTGPDGQVTRRFPFSPESPGCARRFAVEVLTGWGCPEFGDDAAMVVSELATNAVVHAGSDFTLILSRQGPTVRIAVRDRSAALPARRHAPSERGRGLVVIDAIAHRWGQEPMAGAKMVWAELRGED